jgi:hypothetical protein
MPCRASANQNQQSGLSYTARIALDRKSVVTFINKICKTKTGRAVTLDETNITTADRLLCRKSVLTVGMAAQAEIKTGSRRIIQYVLSPISKTANEAGHER